MWEHTSLAAQPWHYALRHLLFWLFFFAFFRAWFVLWLHQKWGEDSPLDVFWRALPLDLSTASYLVLLPALGWLLGSLATPQARDFLTLMLRVFHLVLLVLALAIFGANVFVYEEWNTPLNSRAFDHFRIPGALLNSMSAAFKVGALALAVTLAWVWWRIFRQFTQKTALGPARSPVQRLSALASVLFLLLLIRGGLGLMPINESATYYSSHPFYNHAATNAGWHFIHSLIETRSTVNRYTAMEADSARRIVARLYNNPTESGQRNGPSGAAVERDLMAWLMPTTDQQPNVVLILLESMTAQVVAELGGVPGACPNLSRLAEAGILFEHCYGSGYRTDQGLVSVLGGYPAQPDQSVVFLPDKAEKLPSLSKILKQHGYETAFFYGGQLTFANMGTWLRNQQFEHIISGVDFPRSERTQLWGADDLRLFHKSLEVMHQLPQPFLSTIMTLSLHQPYDVPYTSPWNKNTEREKFLNCAAFVDHAIGEFFRLAAKEPWFSNTVFVLVADHGHPQPGQIAMDKPRSRHIPLLITGPCVNPEWLGRRIGKIGNHHDIPATLLSGLGLSSATFSWSKDLLSPHSKDFAYYSNENGLGWITPKGAGFFPFPKQQWLTYSGTLDTTERAAARAYLQVLYDDFLGL